MDFLIEVFRKPMMKKLLVLVVAIFALYIMKDMLNLLLLTFLFSYLMYNAQKFFHRIIERLFKLKISRVAVTLALYILLTSLIVLAIYKYFPIAIHQIVVILNEVLHAIERLKGQVYNNLILDYLISQLQTIDIGNYLEGKSGYLLKLAGNIGELGLNLFLSLVLSLFFNLEKERVIRFVSGFKDSKISGFIRELTFFGSRLLNSFGKVIQAQILIALCNSILSIIALWILGFHQLLGLGVMIFLLSLIPVAGVAISLVPLSLIAFRMGGVTQVIYVILLIIVLHAVESYVLNPKLMSLKTNLPVFFTFLVLILSEHFMGIWGLIIGIPIFVFALDLVEFKNFDRKEKPDENQVENSPIP